MASDENDSWKTRFNAAGIPPRRGLAVKGESGGAGDVCRPSAAGAERHDGETA
ncbi:sirohydrochlorin cobaltochelatase [Klebsiella pneumoniae]|nr:sirohydrochlorin cobaltochelatase [Klebsiella pneumoniae]